VETRHGIPFGKQQIGEKILAGEEASVCEFNSCTSAVSCDPDTDWPAFNDVENRLDQTLL
tara:strand:- start:116934 stop:117113 length:180 start_codon:yes stop_codon:yes gene_type:complete